MPWATLEALHLFSKQTASPENGVALTYTVAFYPSSDVWVLTAREPDVAGGSNTG